MRDLEKKLKNRNNYKFIIRKIFKKEDESLIAWGLNNQSNINI